MTSSATVVPSLDKHSSRRSIYMVMGCTLFASVAQILLKMAAGHEYPKIDPAHLGTVFTFLLALLSNVPLVFGYALHACNALLLIFALRGGELSILWPIYALSYVWVALLSAYFFGDHINAWKVGGIALIIAGVTLLGRASSQK